MLLFEPKERDDADISRSGESLYRFLDRVDTPFWECVRDLLNDWFSHLPLNEQADVGGRFRQKRQKHAWAAFWELYLHEMFSRLGFVIEHHPPVPERSSRPDFLLSKDDYEFYVEAVIVADPDEEEQAEHDFGMIREAINKVPSRDFFVMFDAVREGDAVPRLQPLIRHIAAWLSTLDADAIDAAGKNRSDWIRVMPRTQLVLGGWVLEFTAIPKKPEARIDGRGSTYGGGPARGRMVDDHLLIEANLRDKAAKYGRLDKPYLIALMSTRPTTDHNEILRALFGLAYECPDMMRAGRVRQGWPSEGLWIDHHGSQNQGVSAVMTATMVHPWSVPRRDVTIWTNPWADYPLGNPLPFSTVSFDIQMAEFETTPSTKTVAEVFDLPLDWPGMEAFPD